MKNFKSKTFLNDDPYNIDVIFSTIFQKKELEQISIGVSIKRSKSNDNILDKIVETRKDQESVLKEINNIKNTLDEIAKEIMSLKVMNDENNS